MKLDEERQTIITGGGERLDLTGTESRLLRYMTLCPGKAGESAAHLHVEPSADLRDVATHISEMSDRELKRTPLSGATSRGQHL